MSSGQCRVVATAGHVDHGKSTLVEALTGTDPDRWAEEKARGLTIDLGFAATVLESGTELSFVDVPGHVRFLPNMLAGVGGVAACLFVVAATEGWKPQSEEHLRILDLLGTAAGVIALTKVDGLEPDEVELARLEVAEAVEGTFLADAPVVAVAPPAGRGLDELRRALDELLAATAEPADTDRPRLWIDRGFSAAGSGTVVTGTLTGGRLAAGDRLEILPGGRAVRVRSLQTHGRPVEAAGPGRRVAVNLSGVGAGEVARGQALVRSDQWEPTAMFDAEFRALPGLDHPVTRRGAFVLHTGTHAAPARIQLLGGAGGLGPMESGHVRARLDPRYPLPLVTGDRYVLRESGRDETIGGGEVLDVAPVLRPARASPDRSPDRVVAEWGWIEADRLERLTGHRRAADVGRWVVAPAARAEAETELRKAVEQAGPAGLDPSLLDERRRTLATSVDWIDTSAGALRLAGDLYELDPGTQDWLAELRRRPFDPPTPGSGVDRAAMRALVRSGEVVEAEGLWFHREAVSRAAGVVAGLLAQEPEGVTVAQVREALGTSRKWALPLLGHLDSAGVTRRRGDRRIGGPRLPGASESEEAAEVRR